MFREEDYINSEEPYLCFDVSRNGCQWAGCLYQRKSGGFDLFYDHASSDFKPIDIGKITQLRHLAEAGNGVAYISHLGEEKSQKTLLQIAKQRLMEWIALRIDN
jgi:hypothetical protein